MEKQWYKVSFYAQMSEEDVKAMKGSFYAAMEESMGIGPCEGLTIEEDREQVGDEPVTTLNLEEDSYMVNEFNGVIKIDKQIYDDYVKNALINICFLDEEDEPVMQYKMIAEDDDWIYCEYIKVEKIFGRSQPTPKIKLN